MKMELLDNGCLKVLLTEEDLQALGLTFDSMDTTNMATQEAIQSLLLTAKHETGFDPSIGLVVEALPVDGGCLLLFTPVCPRRRVRLKKAAGPYIYEAEDTEQLFRLADGLCHHQLLGGPLQPPALPAAHVCAGAAGPGQVIFPGPVRGRGRGGSCGSDHHSEYAGGGVCDTEGPPL